jgi:hypothetical protein
MTSEARSERTERLLVARLDAAVHAAACLGSTHGEVVRLVEGASVATAHAVELALLSDDRAAAIWAAAHERCPGLPGIAPPRAA